MLVTRRSQGRFRRAGVGAVGTIVSVAALVLIPTAVVAGLAVTVHPSGSSVPATGASAAVSVRILATPCVLEPVPGASPVVCVAQYLTVHFIAVVTGGAPPYVYLWSFGDGSLPGFGNPVNHTYPACGSYAVGVGVVSSAGLVSNGTTVSSCPLLV